jgi:hypothetical protein
MTNIMGYHRPDTLLNCMFFRTPLIVMRNFSIPALRAHLMFWSMSAALMIVDDAAMLALIFC